MRFGIIGVGNIGSAHATALYRGEVAGGILAALCDIAPERAKWAKQNFPDIPFFDSDAAFFADAAVDAVIIATPHYAHPTLAETAFAHGFHVLTEKPAGVRASDVARMIRAAERSGKRFGIMWNQRTNPLYATLREWIGAGVLGELQTLSWTVTDWYRTQAYYDSCSWRATWAGEGGGVLMNQAPHQLDLLQWLFGMPDSVSAECFVGKYHAIEVEDEARLSLTYRDGRTATFSTSTGIENGINRLCVCGTKGSVVAENRTLTLTAGDTVTTKTFDTVGTQHRGILEDFVKAVSENRPLLAEGRDGIAEITLANAAYLSAWLRKEVPLPLDTAEFDNRLAERISHSGIKQGVDRHTAGQYEARWQQ